MFVQKRYKERGQFSIARRRMIADQLVSRGIKNSKVLEVMSKVHREEFVDNGMANMAYEDRPLQIGLGQTISQPYIVAYMTEQLELTGREKVLEIGTGSGYQAAILAELVKEVYTIERIDVLSIRSRKILHRLGYTNIKYRIGDGTLGWEEQAPFDRIIVTAGSPVIPEKLCEQLADKGKFVIPVGNENVQQLKIITRTGKHFKTNILTGCRFVKLIGQFGWNNE